MHVLKVGVPKVRFEPFAPQGEALSFEFPSGYRCYTRGEIYGEIVSPSPLQVFMKCEKKRSPSTSCQGCDLETVT